MTYKNSGLFFMEFIAKNAFNHHDLQNIISIVHINRTFSLIFGYFIFLTFFIIYNFLFYF